MKAMSNIFIMYLDNFIYAKKYSRNQINIIVKIIDTPSNRKNNPNGVISNASFL